MVESLVALVTLTFMEIVLGIDNVIFIAILAGRMPPDQQPKVRKIGLSVALITRLLLLGLLFYLNQLDKIKVFDVSWVGIPASWFPEGVSDLTVKELVLLLGGIFLIAKATLEIHHKLEGQEESAAHKEVTSLAMILFQISLLDIVFSLDSVITAVGMAREIWVMVVAMLVATAVMITFAGAISDFVARHPTVKMLALSFLILIGFMLVVDAVGPHGPNHEPAIPKGYVYFAMGFSVAVEMLNLRVRGKAAPVELRDEKLPGR